MNSPVGVLLRGLSSRPCSGLAALLLVSAISLAAAARAASEPPGPAHQVTRWGGVSSPNMVSTAAHLPDDPGNTPPLWELKLGSHQYSIPTIDRGRIYLGLNDAGLDRPGLKPTGGGLLLCLEQNTGKLVWQMPLPRFFDGIKPPYHFDQWNCGLCSGPVVDGERVFVIGNRAEVLCLDREGQRNGNEGPFLEEPEYLGLGKDMNTPLSATDGDIVWRYNLLTELGINGHDVCGSTLLLHGDLLYVCTSNGIDDRHDKIPKPLVPTLVVLNKRTGRLLARDDEKIGQRMFHCNWSSPVSGEVGGRTLIFFGAGDGFLYAFEEPEVEASLEVQTLKRVWGYDCNPPSYRVRDGQAVRYSSASRNSPEGPSEVIGTPVFHKGRVYVTIGQSSVHGVGQGCLSCVDAATGRRIWSSQLVDRTCATASISNGLLYISDYTGNLHCFDTATGERCWVHPMESKVWCASTFVADGKIYAGTDASVLWVLQAGRERKVLSKTRLKAVPITPTAVDGILYLPTQKGLTAVPGRH